MTKTKNILLRRLGANNRFGTRVGRQFSAVHMHVGAGANSLDSVEVATLNPTI